MSLTPNPAAAEGVRRAIGLVTARVETTAGRMTAAEFVHLVASEIEDSDAVDVAGSLATLAEVLLGVLSEVTGRPTADLLRGTGAALGDVE